MNPDNMSLILGFFFFFNAKQCEVYEEEFSMQMPLNSYVDTVLVPILLHTH